jgi:hypothetical protein
VDIVCLQNHHITYINNRLLKAIPFMRNSYIIQGPNNSPRTTGKISENQEDVTMSSSRTRKSSSDSCCIIIVVLLLLIASYTLLVV